MFTHGARMHWFTIEVPQNREVTTYVIRDQQIMYDIPIQLLVLASHDIHLQVQSCPPPQNAEERSGQWGDQLAGCLRAQLSYQVAR